GGESARAHHQPRGPVPRRRGDRMRRRGVLAGIAAARLFASLSARAQQGRSGHVGIMMALVEGDPEGTRYIEAFVQGMQELGWAQGRNLRIEARWGRNRS